MKEHEIVMEAIDEIIEAISGIGGAGSYGEDVVVDTNCDEIIALENGEITVPTRFFNRDKARLVLKLKVDVDYI